MRPIIFLTIMTLAAFVTTFAQTDEKKAESTPKVEIARLEKSEPKEESEATAAEKKGLEDIKYRLLQGNGFLVTEAYLSGDDVISHTLTVERDRNGNWNQTFSETIPLRSNKHQLAISLPASQFKTENNSKVRGVGDVEVEYRYQLLGGDVSRVSAAPGVTAILPTGDYRRELGAGDFGVKFSLPVSIVISRRFMAHSNVGITLTPRARNSEGNRAATSNFQFGQSFVWLAHPKFNPLVEFVWGRNKEVIGHKLTKTTNETFISPGFRWGHTFKNGLTIVPGIAFPIGVGASRGEKGVLFYLNFEHPFKKRRG